MSDNPLFPQSEDSAAKTTDSNAAAVELIRSKVARAFQSEPSATEELAEVKQERTPSKHQQYLAELSSQGKSLAEIQTAWHHYYTQLPDAEKHEVWQEFYAANQHTPYQKLFQKQTPVASRKTIDPLPSRPTVEAQQEPAQGILGTTQPIVSIAQPEHIIPTEDLFTAVPKKTKRPKKAPSTTVGRHARRILDKPAVRDMKQRIAGKVSANGRLQTKHHLQSLAFGIASGVIVLVVVMFSFFNERIIAPFIQPSRVVSSTPIIIGTSGSNIDASTPQIIIPKINVQIPLDFTVQSNDEKEIETALDSGIVHYPSTVKPGQNGNAAFFGHSSNNIFNPGKYKFAFVLLRTLTTGDTFYITYDNKVFVYQVVDHEVVPPSQVGVLADSKGKTATAALITCDPPGTTTNRLVVWGEQISPSVASNTTPTAPVATAASTTSPKQLPDNGPTLWNRFVDTLSFWN